MKRSTSMILLLLFYFIFQIVTIHFSAVTSINQDEEQPEFDYFLFVQHWPGSAEPIVREQSSSGSGSAKKGKNNSKKQTKVEHEPNFGIHGLWPEYDVNRPPYYPQYCDGKKINPRVYDSSLIERLIPRLQIHWHSLASPSEDGSSVQSTSGGFGKPRIKKKEGTWEHEWDRHGTCSLLDQYGYFDASLQLKERHNLLEILVNAGIRPAHKSFNSSTDIVNALTEAIGVTPRIQCNAKNQLYQVYICVNKSADLNFTECPESISNQKNQKNPKNPKNPKNQINQMIIDCKTPEKIEFPSFPSDLHLRDEL